QNSQNNATTTNSHPTNAITNQRQESSSIHQINICDFCKRRNFLIKIIIEYQYL
ncbi:4732_t:CDS:1, partial [Racocetra persica]